MDLEKIFSVTGDMINDDENQPKPDFVLNNQTYREKFWLQEKILVVVHQENMQPGQLKIKDLMWW